MAESTLSLTRDEVRSRISLYLGYGLSINDPDSEELERVDLCLNNGLRRFLNPIVEGQFYEWSFLHPTATLSIANGTQAYNLPDDCFGDLSALVITSGTAGEEITLIDINRLLQMKAKEAASNAIPRYAAVRVKDTTPTTSAGQRYEILFYPTPDASYTVSYSYPVQVDKASSNTLLYGGQHNSQTIVAACLAEAERIFRPGVSGDEQTASTVWEQAYQERLSASVSLDRKIKDSVNAMSFPVSSVTYGTYQWLAQSIGNASGYGWDYNAWTHPQERHVDHVIQRGLQQFYVHPRVESSPNHQWSFLRIAATHSVTSGDDDYDLPADFREVHGDVTFASGSGKVPLTRISEKEYRSLLAKEAASGDPLYYAIAAKTTDQTSTQLREMLLYPDPNATGTLTYRYTAEPAILTTSANYPYGGATHSETILASCMAVLREGTPEHESYYGVFMQKLSASVIADNGSEEAESRTHATTAPTYGTYQWLQRTLGRAMQYGTNPDGWSTEQTANIDEVIQRGLQKFYSPPILDGEHTQHAWSFLSPTATFNTANGDADYNLPSDFRGVIRDVTYGSGTSRVPISRIDEDEYRALVANETATGAAKYYAIRPKTTDNSSGQLWEILLYPTPTATETVTYRYTLTPAVLDTTNNVPYGGNVHAETILCSCLSVMKEGDPARESYQAEFIQRIQASVLSDRENNASTAATVPDTAPTYGTYQWLQRRLGRHLGIGANYNGWGAEQVDRVDDIIQRGLQQFYAPPPMPVSEDAAKPPHKWSFLCPAATITLATSDYDYDLPADFREVSGAVSFAVGNTRRSLSKVNEHRLRSLRSTDDTSGTPYYYAIRPKTTSNTSTQLYELLVYPTPDANVDTDVLTYRYEVEPGVLTTAANYPYGATTHADTILSSCIAVAAEDTGEHAQKYAIFMQRLAASIAVDKRVTVDEAEPWTETTATFGTFDWLQQEVGDAIGFGPNPNGWTHEQEQRINSWINRGVREFYRPSLTGNPQHRFHRWSFLYEHKTLQTSATYSTGTIAATSGVVTLTAGTFPAWAADGEIDVSGTIYTVDSRDSDTQVTLTDTSVSIASGTSYTLVRQYYTLDSECEAIDGPLQYRSSTSGYGAIEVWDSESLVRRRHQHLNATSGVPRYAAIAVLAASTGTTRKIEFFPRADAVYEIHYRCRVTTSALSTGQYPLGGPEHAETVLAACMAMADPRKFREQYLEKLSASIELDQQSQAPETLGVNRDNLDWPYDYNDRMDSVATTYNGALYN